MNRKLLLLICISPFASGIQTLYSQGAPGGVAPAAWYRADATGTVFSNAGITPAINNSTVQQWNSLVGTGNLPLLQNTAASRPVYSTASALANFNPTLTFDGSNDWMQFTAPAGVDIIDRTNGTLYAAGFVNVQKRNGFLGFHPSMDYPGLHMFSTNYHALLFTGGPGYQGLSSNPMSAKSFFTTGASWQNGAGSNASFAAATVSVNGNRIDYSGSQLNNTNLSTSARDLRIGADNNYGAFSGQLNEIIVFEDRLSAAQMDRVETYLSIKYGAVYANGTRNYINSTGATVWNTATNAGYHYNLAGIARDDNGALYQKQSWSTNSGPQVLIGSGSSLAPTNAAHTGTLTDGQYLVWGDNGLPKVPTAPLTAFAGISHHFAAIWKVQNTNATGTVRVAWPKGLRNLTLIQSTDNIIDGTDVATAMSANEITVNGTIYNYADVTLTNGQYFTFAAKLAGPGGVTAGLTQWYRADAALVSVAGDNTNVTTWTDFSRGTVSARIATAPLPFYKAGATNYFNFNPGVHFSNINQMLGNITTRTLENTSFDIFTLTKEGMTGTRYFNIGMNNTTFNGTNWDQPAFYTNGTIGSRNNTGGGLVITNPGNISFSATTPSIMYYKFTNTNMSKGLNGGAPGALSTYSARGLYTGGHIFGSNRGTNPPGGDDWGFTGHIGEVIIYGNGNLSATDRNKVDAYLALKYGLTLPATINYLNSDGNIVWNAVTNATYHNNVAGIANDEGSAFDQKQSISVNRGQQVIIASTGLSNTNALNTTSLAPGQYLVWGDNGLSKVPAVGISSVSNINYRFPAIWKVQNTGATATVRVTWPSGLTNIKLLLSNDPTFATVSADHDMSVNTITINGVSYNYVDVTLPDGIYFTFGSQLNGPGGVGSNLRVWLRADAGFAPDFWTDFSGHENHYTQTNASRQPFVATQQYNFNPIVDFGGSASADGRFMVVPSGKPFSANGLSGTFFTTSLTRTGGTSAYRDIWGFNGTTTGTSLVNANEPAVTKLNNDIVLYSSTTSAFPGRYPDNALLLTDVSYTVATAGIKYGLNGDTARTNQTRSAALSLQANGSVLGSQPEVMNGLIGEAIAYERDLTEAEKIRVRSYIAIKYGMTLPHNYVASNGTTIFWDRSAHTGYNNNITGIVRDDHGSLNQKQSSSIHSRDVLISTTGLADNNASNPVMLNNQQFLVWGNNGLHKGPTVPIAGIPDVNNRFEALWKVQNTNATGTVRVAWPAGFPNMKLIVSTDDVIDATDNIYSMTNTQQINGITYAYVDVTLANGRYFTFAALVRAPGGVTNNLSYWYRADRFAEAAGEDSDVTTWTDFTTGTTLTQLGDNDLPKLKNGNATYFNFNPGINYTNSAQTLGNTAVRTVTALNYDIFTLTKEGLTGGTNGRIFSGLVNNTNLSGSINYWDGIGILADNRIERLTNTYTSRYLANPGTITWAAGHPSIMYNTYSDLNVSKGLNGSPNGANGTHTARGLITGGHAIGSTQFSGNGSDNAGFTGHIGEVIVYGNGQVTAAERNKIETYLAVKYGITLHNSNHYTTSRNVVVWDATANTGYYNNVAAIGRDVISALHQKQSRSQHTNTNSQVIIGLGDIATTNAGNTFSLSDEQFLIWGDNGNAQAMSNTAGTFTTFNFSGGTNNGRRMNRIWKVQNTQVTAEVLIRFPMAAVGTTTLPSGDACAQYAIVFADDAAFSTNVTAIALTENDTDYEALHNFKNGFSYFTFARVTPLKNGEVYLPTVTEETAEYNDNCGTGTWIHFNKTGVATDKLLAMSGYTAADLDSFDVTITPEGIGYDDGTRITNLMPRIATVTNRNISLLPSGKVRIYYSAAEMDAIKIPGSSINGWFKYSGDADSVMTDIYEDGVFDAGRAVAVTPNDSGIEDGIRYVEFHNISSFSSFVFISSIEIDVLPVKLYGFNAVKSGNTALLSWLTASESNNKGFEVQRSQDGLIWTNTGFVASQAQHGNSNEILRYEFTDYQPAKGKNLYRLKQLDRDGQFEFSPIRQLDFTSGSGSNIVLAPNPVDEKLRVTGLSGKNAIMIYTTTGQIIWKAATDNVSEYIVNMSAYTAGVYMIHITDESGTTSTFKIVKQ